MLRTALVAVLGSSIAVASLAQQFQVGNLPPSPTYELPGVTVVDLAAPSPASGKLSSATFAFSSFPCPAAVKIKVFTPPYVTGPRCCPAIGFVDERGPFDLTQAVQTVPLNPPLSIQQGGLIGMASLSGCGHPLGLAGQPHLIAVYQEDVTSVQGIPVVPTGFLPHVDGVTLSLAASGTESFVAEVSGTVPVLFNGNGAAGSHFRTELRLYNPATSTVSGVLRWTASDPQLPPRSIPYSLTPFQVNGVDYPAGFTPLGSVDIIPSAGPGPAALAHVFNDMGSSGTMGFTESDIPPTDSLKSGEGAVLLGPSDPVNFRWNIGFRALDLQASFRVTAFRSDGSVAGFDTRPAYFFPIQNSFQDLLGIPLEPSMTVKVEVVSGRAFSYGVTADNRTNDSSFQLPRRLSSSGN